MSLQHGKTFSVVGVPDADGLVLGRRSDESSAGGPGDASDGAFVSATNGPQPHPRHHFLADLHELACGLLVVWCLLRHVRPHQLWVWHSFYADGARHRSPAQLATKNTKNHKDRSPLFVPSCAFRGYPSCVIRYFTLLAGRETRPQRQCISQVAVAELAKSFGLCAIGRKSGDLRYTLHQSGKPVSLAFHWKPPRQP